MKLSELRKHLADFGVRPSRREGQTFLIDENILHYLSQCLTQLAPPPAVVIEIGSGPGNLTKALLREGFQVIAIEKDRRLIQISRIFTADSRKNLSLLLADALNPPLKNSINFSNCVIAGNIPYSITGAIIKNLASDFPYASVASLVVQEEVGKRLVAKPGEKQYGALTILTSLYWDILKGKKICAGSFYPRPMVDSMHIILKKNKKSLHFNDKLNAFEKLVTGCFKYRRKKIQNALILHFKDEGVFSSPPLILDILKKADIHPQIRPECLSLEDYKRLTAIIEEFNALNKPPG